MTQQFTSANTSINKFKVPALFKAYDWKPGTWNLDYGAGKYDNATEYLKTRGVDNVSYDPYNRTEQENENALSLTLLYGGADTVTISNVLNVIAEKEVRKQVLEHAHEILTYCGECVISVYEGDRTGTGRQTGKDQWQNNMRLDEYMDEVKEVFGNVAKRKGLIIARKEGK